MGHRDGHSISELFCGCSGVWCLVSGVWWPPSGCDSLDKCRAAQSGNWEWVNCSLWLRVSHNTVPGKGVHPLGESGSQRSFHFPSSSWIQHAVDGGTTTLCMRPPRLHAQQVEYGVRRQQQDLTMHDQAHPVAEQLPCTWSPCLNVHSKSGSEVMMTW